MKLLFLLIFFSLTSIYSIGQSKNSGRKKYSYDKVIILCFRLAETPKESAKLPDIIGKPVDENDYTYSAVLNTKEQKQLSEFLIKDTLLLNTDSNCWNPDFGIYFSKKGICTNYIEISTKCENIKSLLIEGKQKPNSNFYPRKMSNKFLLFIKKLKTDYKFPESIPL
ncbi:MAG: hypothetical protein KA319_07690 [Ferruginibacter sp.]|nr:hypothetical protein [Ferruginibacter sp.]